LNIEPAFAKAMSGSASNQPSLKLRRAVLRTPNVEHKRQMAGGSLKAEHRTPNFERGYKEPAAFANASFDVRSWTFDVRSSAFAGIRNTTRQSWRL